MNAEPEDTIYDTASAWALRLRDADDEALSALQVELEQWLAQDEAHADAYRDIAYALGAVRANSAAPEMVTARRDALEFARASGRRRWRTRTPWLTAAAAAAVVLVIGAGLMWLGLGADTTYATAVGETRLITLNDNSRIALDGNTSVTVAYTADARNVRLVRGQAQFDVAKDAARPFRVTAGHQTIVALGTAFNVDMVDGQVLVTLIEGRVTVAGDTLQAAAAQAGPRQLSPGQQMVVKRNGAAELKANINVDDATSWRLGRLVFKDEPLSTVVTRINRHSHMQLAVTDAAAAAIGISGVYTGDTTAFVSAIERYFPVRAVYESQNKISLVAAQ